MGKESKKEWIHVCTRMTYFAAHLELAQHCMSTIIKKKKIKWWSFLKKAFPSGSSPVWPCHFYYAGHLDPGIMCSCSCTVMFLLNLCYEGRNLKGNTKWTCWSTNPWFHLLAENCPGARVEAKSALRRGVLREAGAQAGVRGFVLVKSLRIQRA